MNNALIARMQIPALCLVMAFGTACSTVSPEQLAAVEAKVTSAVSDARKAASDASSAMKAAQAAQSTADAAAAAAASAQSAADSAMSCCNGNKDRIERMFEQTMKK